MGCVNGKSAEKIEENHIKVRRRNAGREEKEEEEEENTTGSVIKSILSASAKSLLSVIEEEV